MRTLGAVHARRAVKHFDPQHRLTDDEVTKLLEAAIQSPTSFNIQHWRFVLIRDPKLRTTIRKEHGHDQAQITDASLLVLMLAAKAMGYDSCPMIGFDLDAVSKLVNLPADHVIGPMVAIGKGTKDTWPKPGQLPLSEVVLTDRFA